jgi:hypothetical protein
VFGTGGACGAVPAARIPSTDGAPVTAGNALFAVNATTGTVTLLSNALPWGSLPLSSANGLVTRASYIVCVNASDAFGGWDAQPVSIAIVAVSLNTPIITGLSGATTMLTSGGETVLFAGSGFIPTGAPANPTVSGVYSNGVRNYTSPSCVVVSNTQISCKTAPGFGIGFSWTITGLTVVFGPFQSSISLAASYGLPSVTSISGPRTGLSTAGAQQLTFAGLNFGPPGTTLSVVYGAALELACTYVANASDANTAIRCLTAAGVGSNLPWMITVGGAGGQIASSTGSTLLSYLPPVITNVTALTAGMVLTQMEAGGNQQVTISGLNFVSARACAARAARRRARAAGPPLTARLRPLPSPLSPPPCTQGPAGTMTDARYGIVVKYGTATGTLLTFASCAQSASAPQTTLTCYTVPGVGTGHAVSIVVGAVPAAAVFAANMAYKAPTITRVYVSAASGASVNQLNTAGGELILIDGTQFGPIVFAIAISLTVTYGHPGDITRYSGQGCIVSSAPPSTPTISCSTDQGVGAGMSFVVSVGGQTSAVFASTAGYAPPQIFVFSGAGAVAANTVGGQPVVITGRNFGPSNAYTNALLSATYGVAFKDGSATFLAKIPRVTYPAAACTVTVPHTQITCSTTEGAGATLGWKLVLDGQASTSPSTSYNVPVVNTITYAAGGAAVTAANVNGGDVVLLTGSFFGPTSYNGSGPLVQRVWYGLSGTEFVASNWTALGQTQIRVTLQPGVGVGLRFTVEVADQTSGPSVGTFSYAVPQILQIAPSRAGTYSNPSSPTVITVITKNLPLLDGSSTYLLTFGQQNYVNASGTITFGGVQPRPLTLPTGFNIARSRNADGSINGTFSLPQDGVGVGLGVQISVLQGSGSRLMALTAMSAATSFSYGDPVFSSVLVTRALFAPVGTNASKISGDTIVCPFGASTFWNCSDSSIVQYTIVGANFGQDPSKTAFPDGVLRNLQLLTGNYSCPAGQTYVLQPVSAPLGCQPVSMGYPGVLGEQWAAAGDSTRALYLYS